MNYEVTLNKVIGRHRIVMDIERVSFNPILGKAAGGGGIRHYRCRLSRPQKEVGVFLSVDAGDEVISVADVLFLVAMDAQSCKMLAEYGEFRNELRSLLAGTDGNLDEIDDFWREYRERHKQAEKVKNFLGDALYDELMGYFKLDALDLAG